MSLLALIDKAEGLLGSAYLKRASLIRVNSDGSESFIGIDLEPILNGESEDLSLLPNDELIFFQTQSYFMKLICRYQAMF